MGEATGKGASLPARDPLTKDSSSEISLGQQILLALFPGRRYVFNMLWSASLEL